MNDREDRLAYDRLRLPFLVVAGFAAGLIWQLLVTPGHGPPVAPVIKLLRNGGHAFLFAILTWPLLSGLPNPLAWRVPAVVITAGYAIATEWFQQNLPGRLASIGDVVIDCSGILLGWALVQWTQARPGGRRRVTPRVLAAGTLCFVLASFETLRNLLATS
ncbi:MAG: VanZ family protein [Planctomycetes bacterium]|nr:VanZ family protein [Planctomycetota bacterium]